MHNLKNNFDIFLPIVKRFLQKSIPVTGKWRGRPPKFGNAELITLNLVAESLGIDSENLLFIKLKSEYRDEFPNLVDRSVYNRRRRRLLPLIDSVRKELVRYMIPDEDTFILDSFPIEICKLVRARRAKICKDNFQTAPAVGFNASHNVHYYGYKLHSLCSLEGIFTSFDLTKASIADVHYLQDVKNLYSNCLILADKGYLSNEYQLNLFEYARVKLQVPMRTNQKNFRKQPFIFRKVRKRIETLFSQLHDQFLIRRNYAKSFSGLKTRIVSKITALTLLQYLNKYVFNNKLNHIKHALA